MALLDAESNTANEVSLKTSCDNVPDTLMIFCYTCNSTVNEKDLRNHLFFGQLNCRLCMTYIATCEKFQECYSKKLFCKHSKNSQHEFVKWKHSCTDYLSYFVRRELVIERFCNNKKGAPSALEVLTEIKEYLSKLSIIENVLPWKINLINGLKHLKDKNFCSNSDSSDNVSKESNNESNKKSTIVSAEQSNKGKPKHKDFVCSKSDNSDSISKKSNQDSNKTSSKASTEHPNEGNSKNLTPDESLEKCRNMAPESKSFKNGENILDSSEKTLEESEIQKVMKSSVGAQTKRNVEGTALLTSKSSSLQKSAETVLLKNNFPQENNSKDVKEIRRDTLPQDHSIHELDDPDDDLQTFNIERLDQAVEYVTVEDDCREKGGTVVSELQFGILQEPDQDQTPKDYEISIGKRKALTGINSSGKLSKKCCKSPSESLDDFKPPDDVANERYLVVHFPTEGCPEECPNCYCEFCPSMLTVNCSTYVSTIICADCNLTIYVLPD